MKKLITWYALAGFVWTLHLGSLIYIIHTARTFNEQERVGIYVYFISLVVLLVLVHVSKPNEK